jgi:hypothetical protein
MQYIYATLVGYEGVKQNIAEMKESRVVSQPETSKQIEE